MLHLCFKLCNLRIAQFWKLRAFGSREAPTVLHAQPHEESGAPIRHVDNLAHGREGPVEDCNKSKLEFECAHIMDGRTTRSLHDVTLDRGVRARRGRTRGEATFGRSQQHHH